MVNLIHKNLIKLYFISLKNNRIYMEYMDGGDLSDLMENNSNLPLDFKFIVCYK
jgi:serine/threonine protein kinase